MDSGSDNFTLDAPFYVDKIGRTITRQASIRRVIFPQRSVAQVCLDRIDGYPMPWETVSAVWDGEGAISIGTRMRGYNKVGFVSYEIVWSKNGRAC